MNITDPEEEPLDFTASIDTDAVLTISSGQQILSQKKITRSGQRSHFTYNNEKITWICEIVKYRGIRNGKKAHILVYLYPININYKSNPLEVELP